MAFRLNPGRRKRPPFPPATPPPPFVLPPAAGQAEDKPEGAKNIPPRLPHGAAFSVRYDADSESWSGTLTVPNLPPFAGRARAILTLLEKLDRYYRRHEESQAKEAVASEQTGQDHQAAKGGA